MFFARLPILVTTALLSLTAADGRAAATESADTATVTVAAPATAAPRGKPQDHARGGDLCAALACTEAQAADILKLRAALREQNKAGKSDREATQRELATMVRSGKLDARKVEALLAKHSDAMRKREAAQAKALVELNGMLDAGQRTKLAALIEGHGMHAVFGGHGKRGGHGKGKGKAARGKSPTGNTKAVSAGAGGGKANKANKAKQKQSRARRFDQR